MRVLLVKLSSMGDLIHALPALSDAARAIPGIEFDWVIDESFADIALFHPAVKQIICSAHRRWSSHKWKTLRQGDLRKFIRQLRTNQYDLVLDAQNNLKSAIVTFLTRGLRCGTNSAGARELGAHLAYQKKIALPHFKEAHAVTRQRQLFATALGYDLPTTPADFGIDVSGLPMLSMALPARYLVFIPNTTWESKHWPKYYWDQLIELAVQAGYHIVFPWGNEKEFSRVSRLSQAHPNATTVLPRLRIAEVARVIHQAVGVITVDTGLAHLTATLNTPAIHLYGPTDSRLLGIQTSNQRFLTPSHPCTPCYLQRCRFDADSVCFIKHLSPTYVWSQFMDLLSPS